MRLADYLLVVFMLVFGMFTLVWMRVEDWPAEWVRWRAEMGDDAAIHEMYKRDVLYNQGKESGYWGRKFRQMTERDLLFMSDEDRKIFQLLGVGETSRTIF